MSHIMEIISWRNKDKYQMKEIYTNASRTILALIKAKLEDEGISCFIRHEFPPAAGEITPATAWPTLCIIDDNQLEKAREILKELLAKQQNEQEKKAWKCKYCDSEVPGEFAICWNCGKSR